MNQTSTQQPLEAVTLENFFEQVPGWNLEPLRINDKSAWHSVWNFFNLMESCRSTMDRWLTVADFMDHANESLSLINGYIQQGLITTLPRA